MNKTLIITPIALTEDQKTIYSLMYINKNNIVANVHFLDIGGKVVGDLYLICKKNNLSFIQVATPKIYKLAQGESPYITDIYLFITDLLAKKFDI